MESWRCGVVGVFTVLTVAINHCLMKVSLDNSVRVGGLVLTVNGNFSIRTYVFIVNNQVRAWSKIC